MTRRSFVPGLLLALLLAAPAALAQPRPPAGTRAAPPAAAGPAAPPAAAGDAAKAAADRPLGLRLDLSVNLRGPGSAWGPPLLDEANRRLYLPRGAAGLVVLQVDGFKPVGEVPGTAGSMAVVLDPETLRGYSLNRPDAGTAGVTPGIAGTAGVTPGIADSTGVTPGITAFDQRSLKPAGTLDLAAPLALALDPATHTLVAATATGLSLIDPATLTVSGTIALDGRPAALALDRRGRLFVTLPDQDAVAVVDLVARKLATNWRLPPCRNPGDLLFEATTLRLIVACRGRGNVAPMGSVIDPFSGQTVGAFTLTAQPDAIAYDSAARLLYFPSALGANVTVYRQVGMSGFEALETAGTRPLAGFAVADPRTGRLILAVAEYVLPIPKPPAPPPPGTPPPAATPQAPVALHLLPNTYSLLVYRRLPID